MQRACTLDLQHLGSEHGSMVLRLQAIQRRQPRSHTIVEAHPDAHAHMLELGWDKRASIMAPLHGLAWLA